MPIWHAGMRGLFGEACSSYSKTFCVVAEAGSLTRAAERLHMAQPAISRQMRALERDLGAVLLKSHTAGSTFTPVGRAVLTCPSGGGRHRACRQVASGEDKAPAVGCHAWSSRWA